MYSSKYIKKGREMNFNELVYALDQRYGNPHAKDCRLIQEAVKMLQLQQAEIEALRGDIADLTEAKDNE